MKQEKIIIWADILATQMNHWTFFAIAMAVSIMSGMGKPPFFAWFVCGFVPILFFFIRRYTNNFPAMAGSHALCLALLFFIPVSNIAAKITLIIYEIGLILYSFHSRLRTEERLDEKLAPPAAVGIIALSLFVLHYEEYTGWDMYYIAMTAFYFICYYIRYYLQQYLYFITVNSGSTGYIPRREIFASGAKLTGIYALLGVTALVLFSNIDWLAWLFGQLKNGIVWLREHGVFAWIASLFAKENKPPITQTGTPETVSPGFLPLEMGEPGLFWVILEKTALTILPIALIALLCFAIIRCIKILKALFRKKRALHEEISADDSLDIREKYEIKKEKEARKEPFVFLNPTQRIRRIYKQRIWAKRERITTKENAYLLSTYTARECGNLLFEEQLAQIYEKARYSGVTCTKEDVKKAVGKASYKNGTAD